MNRPLFTAALLVAASPSQANTLACDYKEEIRLITIDQASLRANVMSSEGLLKGTLRKSDDQYFGVLHADGGVSFVFSLDRWTGVVKLQGLGKEKTPKIRGVCRKAEKL